MVIAYGSRGLTQPEKNYHLHSGKLEYLCLYWAVTQRFNDYLFYAPSFTVISDYNPLQYVMTTARLNSTGFRWMSELSNYNFVVKYRPGKVQTDVDVLSRLILDESKIYQKYNETTSPAEFNMLYKSLKQNWILSITVDPVGYEKELGDCLNFDNLQQFSQSEIALAQLDDLTIRPVVQWKQRRHRPSRSERKDEHHDTTRILLEWNKPELINGVLYRNCGLRKQIVLLKKFHSTVLQELHNNMGHVGVERTANLIRDRFYWPKMLSDIELHLKSCQCLKSKMPNRKQYAPVGHLSSTAPFDMLCIDFLELDPAGSYHYALAVIDHFTCFCQIYPT